MTDRQITHAPGCWGWGPRHYECALSEIELMAAEWERVSAAKAEAEARAERLTEVLKEIRSRLADLPAHPEDPWELIAICRIADAVLAQE